ncbi:helix-turn-helix domain-containing protein [Leptospira licerasiae]|uniref:helix-turn-helix domain-containing protein n=2 Tax=Leptospira TaxID=171 RepID=UPI003015C2B7
MHKHHALQISISLSESLQFSTNKNEMIKSFGIIISPNQFHALRSEGSVLSIYLAPESRLARDLMEKFGPGISSLKIKQIESIKELNSILRTKLIDCGQLYAKLLEKLSFLSGQQNKPITQIDPRITHAATIIYKSIEACEKISARSIGNSVGLSMGRIVHLFSKQIGIPIRSFILWERIQFAIRLILEGAPLTEAAHQAGFADQAHLSRTFRATFGITASGVFNKNNFPTFKICDSMFVNTKISL